VLKNWRAWVLLILLVGPFVAYIGFGALWLKEHRWLLYATSIWIASGIVFAVLAARWTKSHHTLLPPLDWDAPHTFTPFDRQAWDLVQEEAHKGETVTIDELSTFDIYMTTGRRLARRLAAHYHPLSNDPIEHVPVVELLTALELAADDLNRLCRQVPGGDLVTPSHWKRAVQAAEYINWASDIYTYLLPIFQPVTGLVRLGTQKLMVRPAWKNMQQNLLRWFYEAFVNRLGTHLIELYSGRLAIGFEQYRKLTGRHAHVDTHGETKPPALTIAVAGARESGKSQLIEAFEKLRTGDPGIVKAHLQGIGFNEGLIDRFQTARWVEVPGYTVTRGKESARDRSTRRAAVLAAVEADLLLLAIEGTREDTETEVKFAQEWDRWYLEHPGYEIPPALAVVTGADRPEWDGEWKPPHDWARGGSAREVAVRARLDALRATLPPTITNVVAVGLGREQSFGTAEPLMLALASVLHRAERAALIRYFQRASTRSTASRLVAQVGQHGRRLWNNLKTGRSPSEKAG
jgi:uncharacterized protein